MARLVVEMVAALSLAGIFYAGFELWLARRSWRHDREALRAIHGDLDGD
jgi:hypothetical protein